MNARRVLILVLAAVAVLGGLVYWIVPKLERVEQEVVENVSEKARRNPFLAMERYLGRLGYAVETGHRADVIDRPPAATDTIVVEFSEEVFSPARTRKIMEWIAAGGHLVLEIDAARWATDEVPPNALLDLAKVSAEYDEERDDEDEAVAPPRYRLEAGGESYQVGLWPYQYLVDGSGVAEAWTVEGRPQVLRYGYREGLFTVIIDRRMWQNAHIGEFDHALLLTAILGPPGGKVWVLYRVEVASLPELIWQYGARVVVAFAFALALALWALYNRFGPVHVPPLGRRRSLGEHVQAIAAFAWRYGRAATLLHAARTALRYRAEARYPGFQHKSADEQIEWLAARVGRTGAEVRRALEAEVRHHEQLVEITRLLQEMRKSL
jgi:hypothetical protein